METRRPQLESLRDIYAFLRGNTTPIYFVTPCPLNLLGIDQWVGRFEYVSYFDSFDGHHPRVFTPKDTGPREFRSMEEVGNYLLANPETITRFRERGKSGKVLLVMFDEQTEDLVRGLGFEMALPSAKLRAHIDSKITTTRLGNEAGVPSAPNIMGRASDFEELTALATEAGLGGDLVVQTPYGDSGRTTFFIRSKDDWDRYAPKIIDEELKVMKRINHMPGTVEGCATRHGTLVGPIMTDITGFAEITPYKGGWCGNDADPNMLPHPIQDKVTDMVQRLGNRLWQEGYKGVFCVDFLIDTDNHEVYLGEINPRISGASPPTNLITSTYGGCPLFLFHILEFLDVDWKIDLAEVQQRWRQYASWSQLILKQTEDKVELITKAPPSGIWRMNQDGNVSFVRRAAQFTSVGDENEAFYLRVYDAGQYRYYGADLGILLTHGRMQTDDRQLTARAKLWNAGIKAQFEGIPPAPTAPELPAQWQWGKLF
ncbi:MAG: biotin carboxylase [Rhodospirillales bacterium]